MSDFCERIHAPGLFFLDGGMGSLLAELGGSMKSGENNLTHPEIVAEAHRAYLQAGSDALTTNTFTLNGIYAQHQGMSAADAEQALRRGCAIAAETAAAAGRKVYLLGDLGPSGQMLAPYGDGDAETVFRACLRQCEIMAEAPLDAFLIETVFDLREAELMLRAARQAAPGLPVLLSMTFSSTKRGGATIMGDRAAKIARAAAEWGAAAVGGNCGDLSPAEYAVVIAALREACTLPLLAQPNAGKPRLCGDRVSYDLAPEDFAAQLRECIVAGATLLGGCCGTTPAHIAALAALRENATGGE